MAETPSGLSYKDAGVDIAAGASLVDRIKSLAKPTHGAGVLASIGGFAGLFELPTLQAEKPVLVSSTDGVGTKLKLAQALNNHTTIGIDLVAMCVNDIIVTGAKPLFFLDYLATSKLNPNQAADLIQGIANGCQQAECALLGGETAEMPGLYQGEDYDLAGFCVGIVDKTKIIDGQQIVPGSALIALASSGPHSNGYSLIRKIIELNASDLDQPFGTTTLGECLLTPTKIYVATLLKLITQLPLLGIAHITGGGILENLARILPPHTKACIQQSSWQWPKIFTWLQKQGNIAQEEMYKTFNCGVGMIVCIAPEHLPAALDLLKQTGEPAWQIGTIAVKETGEASVELC